MAKKMATTIMGTRSGELGMPGLCGSHANMKSTTHHISEANGMLNVQGAGVWGFRVWGLGFRKHLHYVQPHEPPKLEGY